MKPNKDCNVLINLDARCRDYKAGNYAPDLCPNDGYLIIRGSEIMCGLMDKSTVGAGKKFNLFYIILRDYGGDAAVAAMNRLAKLCARWLANQGFSIGIDDVTPGAVLRREKDKLVEDAYAQCDVLIDEFKAGKLEKQAGCDEELTLENKVQGILSAVRDKVGDICMRELSKNNAPLIMANSGSKGIPLTSICMSLLTCSRIQDQRLPDGCLCRPASYCR